MTHLPLLQRCLEDLRERNKVSAKETTTILITEVSAYLSDAGFLGLELGKSFDTVFEMEVYKEREKYFNQAYLSASKTIPAKGMDRIGITPKDVFETFRKSYKGAKRGLNTEWGNFVKKNRDHKEIVHLLLPAFEAELKYREEKEKANQFVAEFCNLQTWINQRRWETEHPTIEVKKEIKPTGNQPVYTTPKYLP